MGRWLVLACCVLTGAACSAGSVATDDGGLDGVADGGVADGGVADANSGIELRNDGAEVLDLFWQHEILDTYGDAGNAQCAPGEGCFFDPCDANDACQSGWCVQHLGGGVCSQPCQEECPAGWSCHQVAGTDPDVVYICVSDYANLCRPCHDNDDCTSVGGANDACVDYGPSGNFCGGPCGEPAGAAGDKCPWGFACQEVATVEGSPLLQCVNETGECPCTDSSVALGLTTSCSLTNDFGTCQGKRICGGEGLSPCDAATAAAEVCDGLDNDCDDEVDEPDLVEGEYVELCHDGNECTADKCMGEEECLNDVLDTGECTDGNPCTLVDHCVQGSCLGEPVECDDSNGCTDDFCTDTGGCEYPPNNALCDDGDPCTVADQCQDSYCLGTEVPCDCQADGDCAELEDGDLCNGTLVCDTSNLPYLCVVAPETEVVCPEPEGEFAFCLQAACDPTSGECSFVPRHEGFLCDDDDACSVNSKCTEGTCSGGSPVNCNDGNGCTDDACDPGVGCFHVSAEGKCNDGDVCTTDDYCAESVCVGGPALACDDDDVCNGTESCNPQVGCTVGEPLTCDDGDWCNGTEYCDSKIGCVGGQALDCNDGNPCTDDSCSPETGCENMPGENQCSDGNVCTTTDLCLNGECSGAGELDCDDGNPCTDDSCLPDEGCAHSPVAPCCGNQVVEEGEACDDGNDLDGDGCKADCTAESVPTCRALHTDNPGKESGLYLLDPDGPGGIDAFEAYCDMESDGGGWALVARTAVNGSGATLAESVTPDLAGILADERITALLAASTEATNNIKVAVDAQGASQTVSMFAAGEDQRGSYRVSSTANGDCSGYDVGPDDAAFVAGANWGFANGSTGGSIGFHTTQGFALNLCSGADKACNKGYPGPGFYWCYVHNPSQAWGTGSVWVR